jgi:hypothetical protein
MGEISSETQAIVDAVMDLTRVTIALNGEFKTKSEAMRRLSALDIPPVRIAAILAVPPADVRSALAKERKRVSRSGDVGAGDSSTTATEGAASNG